MNPVNFLFMAGVAMGFKIEPKDKGVGNERETINLHFSHNIAQDGEKDTTAVKPVVLVSADEAPLVQTVTAQTLPPLVARNNLLPAIPEPRGDVYNINNYDYTDREMDANPPTGMPKTGLEGLSHPDHPYYFPQPRRWPLGLDFSHVDWVEEGEDCKVLTAEEDRHVDRRPSGRRMEPGMDSKDFLALMQNGVLDAEIFGEETDRATLEDEPEVKMNIILISGCC